MLLPNSLFFLQFLGSVEGSSEIAAFVELSRINSLEISLQNCACILIQD